MKAVKKVLVQLCFVACLALLATSCMSKEQGNTSRQERSITEVESQEVVEDTNEPEAPLPRASILAEDSSLYSSRFLQSLATPDHQSVYLEDSFMILGTSDTISFPNIPKLEQRATLTAIQDNLAIALHVERINYSSIRYRLELTEFGKTSIEKKGTADLHSHFYFGAESDVFSGTGESYLSTEFSDKQDSYYTAIRLGRHPSSSRLLGKITCNCNGTIRDIDLSNFKTLVEKK